MLLAEDVSQWACKPQAYLMPFYFTTFPKASFLTTAQLTGAFLFHGAKDLFEICSKQETFLPLFLSTPTTAAAQESLTWEKSLYFPCRHPCSTGEEINTHTDHNCQLPGIILDKQDLTVREINGRGLTLKQTKLYC